MPASAICVLRQAFTGMIIITVEDSLTHQVLMLTPSEAAALRGELMRLDLSTDQASERESASMKALTLYNGHSLPSVKRAEFENSKNVTARFDFELRQRVRDDTGNIVETKSVGVI